MGNQYLEPPLHGVDGWDLADYDWDELSGVGRCVYRKEGVERVIINRLQRVSDEFHNRVAEEQMALNASSSSPVTA